MSIQTEEAASIGIVAESPGNHVGAPPVVSSRRKPRSSRSGVLAAAPFLAPNLIGFLAFTLFPVVFSFLMAFTNWSLKPAVKFQFVGLRNFTDLMSFAPVAQSNSALLASFVAFGALVIAGTAFALWANMAQWTGTRVGGALLALGGLWFAVTGTALGAQGTAILGVIALVCGGAASMRDAPWRLGRGTLPALMLVGGAAGMWCLRSAFLKTYQPTDGYFWQYFYNTVYLMIGIPLSILGSLVLALLLNEELPVGPVRTRIVASATLVVVGLVLGGVIWAHGDSNLGLLCGLLWAVAAIGIAFNVVAFRTLFYLPTFTAGVALMILWKALYNPQTGPINVGLGALFHALGIHAPLPQWLADVSWAKPALIVMGVWTGIGGTNMLLYLAGLSNLPKELIDAASVDGAGTWAKFRHVTWPQLAPTTFFVSVMSIIGGLQGGFDQARVMTQGGPAGSTTTLAYYIYNKAFQDLDMGYAAAISWILFAIVFIATAINWKFGKGLETD